GEDHVDAAALVLVDIAPRIEPAGAAKIGAFMGQKPDGFDSLEEVADAIASYQPHRTRPRSLDGLAKNVRLGEDGRYHWHWDPAFRQGERNLEKRQDRLEECARSLALPTLLVRGGSSDILTEEGAAEFMALCPSAEYVNIAGAAHMVAGDKNDIFADAVIEFLHRRVPAVIEPHGPKPEPHHLGPPGDILDVPRPPARTLAAVAEITLYEAVGGMPFFMALVDAFYDGVAADPEFLAIYPTPDDLGPARRRLALFLGQYWGGPTTYSNERGHPRLRLRHMPFAIG